MSKRDKRLQRIRDNYQVGFMGLKYVIVLSPDEDGWIATIPDLPGCMAVGETKEEALELIEDARRSWIEASLLRGLAIPMPQVSAQHS